MTHLCGSARTLMRDVLVGITSQNHTFTYDEPIKVESVTQSVGDLAMRFGESTADEDAKMVRTFVAFTRHAV